MNKIIKLSLSIFGAFSFFNSLNAQQKPNIVFILVDDMGIGDVECYGQKQIKTPNINMLAESGMKFTHHYSGSSVSAPSRCSLLTGKHTGHSYIRGNKGVNKLNTSFDLHLPVEELTVAEILKDEGYATMCVGKWGLGGPGTSGSPINKGFDYFFGYLSQGSAHRYYPEYLFENEDKVYLNGEIYSHFMIMDKGLDFIDKNSDKPIFAYFAITPPHADLDYPDISQYDGKFDEIPFINNKNKGFKTQLKPKAAYASMISEIDNNVGQIIELLRKKNMLDNTIILFSSDNGVHNVGGHDPEYFNSNLHFRGWKRDLYEGGIRTPFIVSWPNVIKPKSETSHISAFWDFLPTVCDIVNVKSPKDTDGISFMPTLIGKPKKQKKHDFIYYEFYEQGGKQSIMKDGWKLIRLNMSNKNNIVEELYNIKTDESEQYNVISENPKIADKLRLMINKVRIESTEFRWH